MHDSFKVGLLFQNKLSVAALQGWFFFPEPIHPVWILKTVHIYITDGPINKMLHFSEERSWELITVRWRDKHEIKNTVPPLSLFWLVCFSAFMDGKACNKILQDQEILKKWVWIFRHQFLSLFLHSLLKANLNQGKLNLLDRDHFFMFKEIKGIQACTCFITRKISRVPSPFESCRFFAINAANHPFTPLELLSYQRKSRKMIAMCKIIVQPQKVEL